jgi:hypothetical protein
MAKLLKLIIAVILTISLLCSLSYGLTNSINSFLNQNNPFNMTFTPEQNKTFFLNVPSYSNIRNISILLSTLDPQEINISNNNSIGENPIYNLTNPIYYDEYYFLCNSPFNFSENMINGDLSNYGTCYGQGGKDLFIYTNLSLSSTNNFSLGWHWQTISSGTRGSPWGADVEFWLYNFTLNDWQTVFFQNIPFDFNGEDTTNIDIEYDSDFIVNNKIATKRKIHIQVQSSPNFQEARDYGINISNQSTNILLNITDINNGFREENRIRGIARNYINFSFNYKENSKFRINYTYLCNDYINISYLNNSIWETIYYGCDALGGSPNNTYISFEILSSSDIVNFKVSSGRNESFAINSLINTEILSNINNISIYVDNILDFNKNIYDSNILYSTNITKVNNILNNNCVCDDCIINNNNCEIPFIFYSETSGKLQINLTNASYEIGVENCTGNFNYSVLNMSYYDQISLNPITASNGYNLQYSDGYDIFNVSGNFDGNTNDQLCTNIDPNDRTVNWTMYGQLLLTKDLYATNYYTVTQTNAFDISNNPITNLSLFLIELDNSSTVTYTWYTAEYALIDGLMEIYECAGDGTRTLIGSNNIIDGAASANIELLNKPYSYEVIINGNRFTDFGGYSKCHLETNTELTFYVQTIPDTVSPLIGFSAIECNMTQTGTDTVKMEWGTNSQDTSAITGCLFAYRLGIGNATLVYTNCTSTEFSIERTVPNTGYQYTVVSKLYQSGFSKECDNSITFNFENTTSSVWSINAIMCIIFLITATSLFWAGEGELQLLGGGVAVVVAFIFGILSLPLPIVIGVIFFLTIIAVVGRYSRKSG